MAATYADGTQFLQRYDTRLVGELVSDTGTAVASPSGNANLSAALNDASADITSAATAGGAYTVDVLIGLSDESDPLIIRLTCDLAIGYLFQRRGQGMPDGIRDVVDRANDKLGQLRRGVRLFDVAANRLASTSEAFRPSDSAVRRTMPHTTSDLYPPPLDGSLPR